MPAKLYWEIRPLVEALRFEDEAEAADLFKSASPVFEGNTIMFSCGIRGLDQRSSANKGDWLLKHSDGRFSSCPNELFELSYAVAK